MIHVIIKIQVQTATYVLISNNSFIRRDGFYFFEPYVSSIILLLKNNKHLTLIIKLLHSICLTR